MKILLLDNYDSFTYNLVHYLESLGAEVEVFRNDEIELEEVKHFDKIVLSPGPGIPEKAGILKSLIKEYSGKKPILGICLGQQAIAEVFGGSIIQLDEVVHGTATPINVVVSDEILFNAGHEIKNDFRMDQNRISLGVGYQRKNMTFQVAYMNQLIESNTDYTFKMNHNLQILVFHNFDLRKKSASE